MACGCIQTPPNGCNLQVEVCNGWHIILNIQGNILTQPSNGVLTQTDSYVVYDHNGENLNSDSFTYDNGVSICTVNITITNEIPQDTQLVELSASGSCAVGNASYEWTLPENVTIHPNDTIYQQTIHVFIPDYDPFHPDLSYTFKVNICCGNCNDCCRCDYYTWTPPICNDDCQEDNQCYCGDECFVYDEVTGNCVALCPEGTNCCPGIEEEKPDTEYYLNVSSECNVDLVSETFLGSFEHTLTINTNAYNYSVYVINPDYMPEGEFECISFELWPEEEQILLEQNTPVEIHDNIIVELIGDTIEYRFYDKDLTGLPLTAYFPITYFIEANAPCGKLKYSYFAGPYVWMQANGDLPDGWEENACDYVVEAGVEDFNICPTENLICESVVYKTTPTCKECCFHQQCATGNCGVDGVCYCEDGVTTPIDGVCPCPTNLPPCFTCTPGLPGPLIIDNTPICTGNQVNVVLNNGTCSCACAPGYCLNSNNECIVCPNCPVPSLGTIFQWNVSTGTYDIYVAPNCPLCYNCNSEGNCIPPICSVGEILNPSPTNAANCCLPDPCYSIDCETCPNPENPGCGCIEESDQCISCSAVLCSQDSDCPLGCDCNNGNCQYNPCDIYSCSRNDLICPGIEGCGCINNACKPCSNFTCTTNIDCPEGCSCFGGICGNNPCLNITCDDVSLPCAMQDGCGCDDAFECIPCQSITCTEYEDCPLGCNCVDNLCEHDPCTFITNECIIEFSQPNTPFTLDITNGTNIVLTPVFEVFGNDNYLSLNSSTVKWEINVSNFLYGFIPVAGIAGITANLNGTLTINTSVFTTPYFLVRCEIIGTGITTTYRYDGLAPNEELMLNYSFDQAFGNICYRTIYAPIENTAEVTSWDFGGTIITPEQPHLVQQDAPVLFAGSHYFIYTCSDLDPDIEISALVHSNICEEVTICGQLISCPCSGARNCDDITIDTSSVLTTNIWELSLDIFDSNGEQRPWLCEPLSSLQYCGNTVNSYNCGCGGINPYESTDPAECLDDDLLNNYCNNAVNNNNYNGSANPGNCCCGWTYSPAVEILELEGSYIKVQINDYQNASLCFKAELDGNSGSNECCVSNCFFPPAVEDCSFNASISFSCGQENPDQIMGTLSATGLTPTISGTPLYSITYTGINGPVTLNNIEHNDIFELEILPGINYDFTISSMQLNCEVEYNATTNCDCLPEIQYQFYFCDKIEDPDQTIGLPIGIKINNIFTGAGYSWDVNIHSNTGLFPDINTTIPYLGNEYIYITQNGNGEVGVAPQSNAFDCDPGTPYSGPFTINWYEADVVVTFNLQNSYCNIVTNYNDNCVMLATVDIDDIDVTCNTNDGTYDLTITYTALQGNIAYAEVINCDNGILTEYSDTGTITITGCDPSDDIIVNLWPLAGCPDSEVITLDSLPPCLGCNLDMDASYDCENEVLNIIIFDGNGPYELSEAVTTPIVFNSGHYSVNLPDLVVNSNIVDVKVTNEDGICIFTKSIDISTCDSIECGTEPTVSYSCTTGFAFTDVDFGGGDTATFYGFPYSVGNTGISVSNLTVVPCEDGASGLVYIVKSPECTYLLPIDTRCIDGTIDLTGSNFLDPNTNFVCDTNHIQVILTDGPSSMVLNCAECSNLVNVPVTEGEIDLFCNLVDDNETELTLEFSSTISDCTFDLVIERTGCPDPCNNDPDLLITCQDCTQQIWGTVDLIPNDPDVHLIGVNIDNNLYGIIGTYGLGVSFDGGANYLDAVDMIYSNTGILLKYKVIDGILVVYGIGDCCLDYTTVEIIVCTLSGLSCNNPTIVKLQISNPTATCQMIKDFFSEPDYVCCTCYKAYRTGPVVDVDTDIIYYNCENDIDLNNWTEYLVEGNCVPICKTTGELLFFREVTYTTGCRPSLFRYNIEDSNSYVSCTVLRSAFIVRIQNTGDYTIPNGTEFNLVWSGLGGAANYVALQGGTINNPLGTIFTTNTNIAPGQIFSFAVGHNTLACPGQTVSVEVSTSDINLFFTPLIIEITS